MTGGRTPADAILVCDRPRDAAWGLGSFAPNSGRVLLIGWTQDAASVEAEVPRAVASALAQALTVASRLSFLLPAEDAETPYEPRHPDILFVPAGETGLIGSLKNLAFPAPRMISTLLPATVERLFCDPGWFLGGQIAVLSDRSAGPPALDRAAVLELTGRDWLEAAAHLGSSGVAAVLKPGVDGDVAALYAADERRMDEFLAAIGTCARDRGLSLLRLGEAEFRAALGADGAG